MDAVARASSPSCLTNSGNVLCQIRFDSQSLAAALARSRPLPSGASLDLIRSLSSFPGASNDDHCSACPPPPSAGSPGDVGHDAVSTTICAIGRARTVVVVGAGGVSSRAAPLVPSDTPSLPHDLQRRRPETPPSLSLNGVMVDVGGIFAVAGGALSLFPSGGSDASYRDARSLRRAFERGDASSQ